MKITIAPGDQSPLVERVHVLSMTIKTFKGRRNVDVHLFRSCWSEDEESCFDWNILLDLDQSVDRNESAGSAKGRKIILEAFTEAERDIIINYLKDQYSTRITRIHSASLNFPIPCALPPLSEAEEGKSIGLIAFEKIPSYSLDIPLKGLYDLNQHPPIVAEE